MTNPFKHSVAAGLSATTAEEIDALIQQFQTLTEHEQQLVMLLAVIYKPIGATKLSTVVGILCDWGMFIGRKTDYVLSTERKTALHRQQIIYAGKDGLQINPLIANVLVSQLPLRAFQDFLMAAEEVVPVVHSLHWQTKAVDERRVIRDLYFLGEMDEVENLLAIDKDPQIIHHTKNRVLVELLFLPFELETFLAVPHAVQYQAFATLLREVQASGHSFDYAVTLLEQVCAAHHAANAVYIPCVQLLAEFTFYQGRFEQFDQLVATLDSSSYSVQLKAIDCFVRGDVGESLALFSAALTAKNKIKRRKHPYLSGIAGYFYKLALMVNANRTDGSEYAQVLAQVDAEERQRQHEDELYPLSRHSVATVRSLSDGLEYKLPIEQHCVPEDYQCWVHHLGYYNYALAQVWCNQRVDPSLAKRMQASATAFVHMGSELFARLCDQLVTQLQGTEAVDTTPLNDISQMIKPKARWELALDKLITLASKPAAEEPAASAKPVRIIWELIEGFEHRLQAREQKRSQSGWSKGRVVSLKRLKTETDAFSFLSDRDRVVCQAIQEHAGWNYYGKLEYSLSGISALTAAVGLNNLYAENDFSEPLELVQREPELTLSQVGDELCLSMADVPETSQRFAAEGDYQLKKVADRRFQLTVFSAEHLQVASIVGESGLLVPMQAKQKALDSIAAIAPFLNIQSTLPDLDTGLATCKPDPHLVVNIQPAQQGLEFSCHVMPFGEHGPALIPGRGSASLTADVDGQRKATQRDLAYEQQLLDQLDDACPAFLAMPGHVLSLEDTQDALNALEQLTQAKANMKLPLLLRWPKGKKISLTKKLEAQHLQLALGKQSEWFDITGDLSINDTEVIELRKLLALVSTSHGRYVALDNHQVLSLSDDLRNKLEQLNRITDEGKFHPLASAHIEQATTGMRMKTLHAWDRQTEKMHQANAIEPKLPSTFQASLRDYQVIGFDWAMRLAHWGAGACLADDMGLGKTLQALAVLLARADKGPSLVIAPTSVCFNWQQEALKFTPTLNLHRFSDAQTTSARQALLSTVGPFDCVVISYGLLQREIDLLKTVAWRTVVADEAQALKNPLAKRTKAAYALNGEFKMITTGTPVENNLTELWSLFRFITPGLLGNLKRFTQRFAVPIENSKDDKLAARKASQQLKTLIQPFILRRMKSQVLTELPPRTEITVPVELSSAERTFYEALRLNAIDNITQSGQHAGAGEQRIKMLAELIKLRQACCHPQLVMAESRLASAKLNALDELLNELKQNNHKALIFSQFVGHLKLIAQHIESKGLDYQYLDGSTTQAQREQRVTAFQRGEGDVFLISLKAGGSGLNLTAADYVIHMDPWWNPAVEEQASDRAHRIGQMRPVTIYRLIAQNTIEEKIVALHQHKRDIADSLLSGNDVASALSVEDMLNLLKETF
ncbi:DEAD/DEAH box helicase [Alteromonas oceanisediminis]|uniref:DEAD/DEAH box helicase n=1 Tax=Alteromonas oceanisediminis TaxID=2836180 RepID=UPI001BDA6AD5|nr:DEAD/DEAH box helicase [Alteromonas oceanisediminis]MBT0586265.1 DEAD/DEAH box helicase [Alteromonas oceanisediminis]